MIIPGATLGLVTNETGSLAGDYYPIGLIVGFAMENGQVIGQGTAQTAANTPAQLITTATNTTVEKYQAQYIPLTEDMILKGTLSAVAGTTGWVFNSATGDIIVNSNASNDAGDNTFEKY